MRLHRRNWMIIYKYSIGDIMNLNEAVKELEEHGYLVEYTKDEYDSAMKNRQDPNDAARRKVIDDPEYKRLSNRKSRELRAHSTDWGDYNKMRVPGKRPGTTRLATASERRDAYEKNKIKNKEILQKYNSLQKQMQDKLRKKYLKILEDEDMTMKEYESNCHDWCIINWFDAPGSGYNPVIVQKGYNSKEEGEKDLEQFKKWAWTEVEYTDVEQQCYALYPTEIIEEMGLDYKEKDVPEGEPPEFKGNPYYRTNYWGD